MEYHKIETLYERDMTTHKLAQPLVLKNPTYSLLKDWEFTEKIDGTNIRCIWTPALQSELVGSVPANIRFAGKTDNAQVPARRRRREAGGSRLHSWRGEMVRALASIRFLPIRRLSL